MYYWCKAGFVLFVFAAEVIGWTTLGWRKATDYELNTGYRETDEKSKPMVVQSPVSEDESHPDVILKNNGRTFLEKAQDIGLALVDRISFARQAIQIFAEIKKDSPAYYSALYNMGTGYRILGHFRKAVRLYLKVKKLILASELYTKEERRLWEADIEMMIGNVWEAQRELKKARDYFFRAYVIDPENFIRLRNLFDISIKMRRLKEAVMWKELLSKRPEYPLFSEIIEAALAQLQKEIEQSEEVGQDR